ncbi:hypothetical protein QTP88_026143 [Uroleucon formosanum]
MDIVQQIESVDVNKDGLGNFAREKYLSQNTIIIGRNIHILVKMMMMIWMIMMKCPKVIIDGIDCTISMIF